jgi:hypothetical protein
VHSRTADICNPCERFLAGQRGQPSVALMAFFFTVRKAVGLMGWVFGLQWMRVGKGGSGPVHPGPRCLQVLLFHRQPGVVAGLCSCQHELIVCYPSVARMVVLRTPVWTYSIDQSAYGR